MQLKLLLKIGSDLKSPCTNLQKRKETCYYFKCLLIIKENKLIHLKNKLGYRRMLCKIVKKCLKKTQKFSTTFQKTIKVEVEVQLEKLKKKQKKSKKKYKILKN